MPAARISCRALKEKRKKGKKKKTKRATDVGYEPLRVKNRSSERFSARLYVTISTAIAVSPRMLIKRHATDHCVGRLCRTMPLTYDRSIAPRVNAKKNLVSAVLPAIRTIKFVASIVLSTLSSPSIRPFYLVRIVNSNHFCELVSSDARSRNKIAVTDTRTGAGRV